MFPPHGVANLSDETLCIVGAKRARRSIHQGSTDLTTARAIIELTETALRVVAVKGRDAQARTRTLVGVDFQDAWPACLEKLQEPLQTLIAEMGLKGAAATIVYESPTSVSGVFSCPISAGLRKAEQAAMLNLADSCQFELQEHPHTLKRLAGDRKPEQGAPGAQQVHFVGAADEDASLQAVAAWATAGGVKPDEFVPIDSAVMATAARSALQHADKHGAVAVLCASERGSALAAASNGKLAFVRPIGVGLDDLAHAVVRCRDERASATPSDTTPTSFDSWTWLKEHGIPVAGDPDGVVDESTRLTAGQVLPRLQPVIQRWSVEIKQSMRFGLGNGSKDKARLAVIGPGASVPRLAEAIAQHAGLELVASGEGAGAGTSGPGAWRGWLAMSRLGLALMPNSMMSKMRSGQMRRMMLAGCVLAGAVVAAQAWHARSQLGAVQARLASAREQLANIEPQMLGVRQSAEARAGLAQARREMDRVLGQTAPWSDWLGAIATELPSGVWLRSIRLADEQGQLVCTIEGETAIGSAESSHAMVKSLVERLAGLPATQSCRVARSQREGVPGRMRQTFELSVKLHGVPGAATSAMASVPTSEDRP